MERNNTSSNKSTSALITSLLQDVRENPQNTALILALSLGTDLGASALVAAGTMAVGPAKNFARQLVSPPLDSNHVLLQMVHECKWQAVIVILREIHNDQSGFGFNTKLIKELMEIAEWHKKRPINKKLDPRNENITRPSKFENFLNIFMHTKPSEDIKFSPTDQHLLENLTTFLAREPGNQGISRQEYQRAISEVTAGIAEELLLDEICAARYKITRGQPHIFAVKRNGNSALDYFLTQFEDPELGWSATYRVLLKDKISADATTANRVLLNLGSENQAIALHSHQLVDDSVQRLQAIQSVLDTDLARIVALLSPELPLDPEGRSVSSPELVDFIPYVYTERVTGFTGRDSELEQLHAFLDADADLRWWQIGGAAGQGKSRLALELVRAASAEGWHAGFLEYSAMRNRNEWPTLSIMRPTLIVIDYVAAPEKAQRAGEALRQLAKRFRDMNIDEEVVQKVRLLIVERSPFQLGGRSSRNPEGEQVSSEKALWFDHFCNGAHLQTAIDSMWRQEPLALDDLTEDDMLSIARSWRKETDRTALSEVEEQSLVEALRGKSGALGRKARAWRPLFAMILAGNDQTGAHLNLGDAVRFALQVEKDQFWRDPQSSPIEFEDGARRLAALTLFTTELETFELDQDFYACDEEHAQLLLGKRVLPIGDTMKPKRVLQTRSPDLFAEYLLHWLDLSDDELRRIVFDAWCIDPGATLGYFIRLSEDRRDLGIAETVRRAANMWGPDDLRVPDIPSEIAAYAGLSWLLEAALQQGDSLINSTLLLIAAENGQAEVVVQLLKVADIDVNQTNSKSGTFPLLMAAQEGHTEVVAQLLNVADIDVNQTDPIDGTFPLLLAAQNGHAEVVVQLLNVADIDVNQIHANGGFPLLMAAQEGHAEVVVQLLNVADIEVNQTNSNSGTFPLLMAAQNGHAEVVVQLLKVADIDVNQTNSNSGNFPLLQAAQNGHAEVVVQLLNVADIDVNQTDPIDGTFPLLLAAQNGHAEVVVQLLNVADIDVNQTNSNSGTFPLLMAAQNGHAEVVVQLLNVADIDVNQTNSNSGAFPLLLAAQNGHAEVVVQLLNVADIDVNQTNSNSGAFPLLLAAQNGHAEVVVQLLNVADIDVNQIHANGGFPLLMAAQEGHAEVVVQLLNVADIEVNQTNSNSGTFPLLMAAQNGHAEVVVQLLNVADIDVNQTNSNSGNFPLLMAAQNGHAEVVVQLLNVADIDVNQIHANGGFPLLMAAQEGHAEVVVQLLNVADIDVNQTNSNNGTFPLLQAAQNGHAEVVVQLLNVADIDVNQTNSNNGTFPLLMAAQNGHAEVVVQLLNVADIEVNQTNSNSGTFPLLMAAQNGHAEVVVQLLNVADIDVNQTNSNNGTFPLLMAAQNGHAEVVVQLLNVADIDVNQTNSNNGTFPLLMAAQNGHAEVVVQLLKVADIDVNQTNPSNDAFSLLVAALLQNLLIVELLLSHGADPAQKVQSQGLNTLDICIMAADAAEPEAHSEWRKSVSQMVALGMRLSDGSVPDGLEE